MSTQILLLDRVEFNLIKIEARQGEFAFNDLFPQLTIEAEDTSILTRSGLVFPVDQAEDPRVFVLTYGIKVTGEDLAADKKSPPYEIEVEAAGYFRYVGGDDFKGEDRFRAVRFSGYQILYGAIREMVSNLTARGRHGLWHLPARNFGGIAKARAEEDEARRQKLLETVSAEPAIEAQKPTRKRSARNSSNRIGA